MGRLVRTNAQLSTANTHAHMRRVLALVLRRRDFRIKNFFGTLLTITFNNSRSRYD